MVDEFPDVDPELKRQKEIREALSIIELLMEDFTYKKMVLKNLHSKLISIFEGSLK